MQIHKLKTEERYFDAVERGEKTFEVRKNDRAFQTGDMLVLIKTDEKGYHITEPDNRFKDITIRRRITYLLQGGQFGIEPQYCVLGLGPCEEESA